MSSNEPTILSGVIGPDGLIDPDRLCSMFLISSSELMVAIGLGRPDASLPAEWTSPAVQVRLSEVTQIIERVLPWCGSPQQAFAWFRSQPIPGFGGQTAEDLVCAGRVAHVASHLERIAAGGFA
jgi:hypothetical protein